MPLFAIPFPAIDPVLISIGPFAIRWYALAYIAGIVLGWRLVRRIVQRPGWRVTPEAVDDLVFYVTLGVILGGRIGYVLFYQPATTSPIRWTCWPSGAAACRSTAACSACWSRRSLFARSRGLAFFEVTDALAVATPIGLFLGRHRQLHQCRAVGPGHRRALGRGLPDRRAGAAPSQPALRGGLEGVVLFAVMLWFARRPYAPGGARPAQRRLPDRLRAGPDHGRALPRARPADRLPRRRDHHGPAAVPADARVRASSSSCARRAPVEAWG